MKIRQLMGLGVAAAALAGCNSDVVLQPTVNNAGGAAGGGAAVGGGAANNPCATYTEAGQTFQGSVDANGNCFYDSNFVSDTNPITVSSITFPNFGGLHIFEDSLYIGDDVNANAAATGRRIPQEGEGTRLNIEAGNTMVFEAADSYLRVARGSQIFAIGTDAEPITFTADEDAVLGVAHGERSWALGRFADQR